MLGSRRRLHRAGGLFGVLVVILAGGCGGKQQAVPPARHVAPLRHIAVTVLDGDTGQLVSGARLSARGALARGRVLLTRVRTSPLLITASARNYTNRRVEVTSKTSRVTVRLYRSDGQWLMYGAGATRTQFQPAIRLRPPFRVVWGRNLGGMLEFPAVVDDGVAYLTNFNGQLYALSMDDGRTLWRRNLNAKPQASSPAVVGSQLVVHAMSSGRVVVLDRASGRVIWSMATSAPIESSPGVVDGVDYMGNWAGDIYALDLRTHRARWVYHDGCKITASVTISGGVIYVGDYCGRLLALRRSTGALLWSSSAGSPVYGASAVAGGRVFVPSRDAGALYAFTTNGRPLWHVSTGGLVYSAPAVWKGRVYFGSYTGLLYCVSARTGSVLWTLNTGGRISGSPTVIDGVAYTGTFAHRIFGADARTGRQLFSFPHGEYVPLSGNRGRLLLYGWSSLWAVEPRP